MADDQFLIRPRPEPEKTQLAQHPKEQKRATWAIWIAIAAALLVGWQAYESHNGRIEANAASAKQAADVERARKAAEESAQAASRSAKATEKLATTAAGALKQSELLSEQAMKANASMQRAYIVLASPRINLVHEGRQTGINMQFDTTNIGLTAARAVSEEVDCGFFEQGATVSFPPRTRTKDAFSLAPRQPHMTGLTMFGLFGSALPRQEGEILISLGRGNPVCVVRVRYMDVFGNAHQTDECLADWAIRVPLTVETRAMSPCGSLFTIKPPLKNF